MGEVKHIECINPDCAMKPLLSEGEADEFYGFCEACMNLRSHLFKVQLSITTTHDHRRVLIYNEDRSLRHEADAPKSIIDIMDGSNKKYFYGFLQLDNQIALTEEETEERYFF